MVMRVNSIFIATVADDAVAAALAVRVVPVYIVAVLFHFPLFFPIQKCGKQAIQVDEEKTNFYQ